MEVESRIPLIPLLAKEQTHIYKSGVPPVLDNTSSNQPVSTDYRL